MPYMRIFKGEDGKWHYLHAAKTAITRCEEKETMGAERKRVGGGRMCGNDEDPPIDEMCEKCFSHVSRNSK